MNEERKPYAGPPLALLQVREKPDRRGTRIDWVAAQEIFENKLYQYGVDVRLAGAERGPSVTTYRLKCGSKTAFTKLWKMRVDLQRWCRSQRPLCIYATEEGYVEVQVKNPMAEIVSLREVLESERYRLAEGDLVIPIGKTDRGEILVDDLAAFPNALIAGETGSGKSVFLNAVIAGLVFRYSPEEVRFLFVDLKEVEMTPYAGLPHSLTKYALSDMSEIIAAFRWAREELVRRLETFKSMRVRSIREYNAQEDVKKLPRIVIVVDEASELMTKKEAQKAVEQTVTSMARLGRAAGIHFLFATQNPTRAVITGEIQNDLNTKIAFAVGDAAQSTTILKQRDAECLIGRGDMFIKRGQDVRRAQCAFIGSDETDAIMAFVKEHNDATEPISFEEPTAPQEEQKKTKNPAERIPTAKKPATKLAAKAPATKQEKAPEKKTPAKKTQEKKTPAKKAAKPVPETTETKAAPVEIPETWIALRWLAEANHVSSSYLQRKMKKGYLAVSAILEDLQREGYVSAPAGGKRTLLVTKEQFIEEWEKRFGAYEGVGADPLE